MDLFPSMLGSLGCEEIGPAGVDIWCDTNDGSEDEAVKVQLLEDDPYSGHDLLDRLDRFQNHYEGSSDEGAGQDSVSSASLPLSPPSYWDDRATPRPSRKRDRRSSTNDGAGLSKNAIAARENRIKKKRYIDGLEKSVQHFSKENRRLEALTEELGDRCKELTTEVSYLHSVLANVDEIASLVRAVRGVPGLASLGCGLAGGDHAIPRSATHKKRGKPVSVRASPTPAGVCLHVNNKKVSLEFCPQCSDRAASAREAPE